MVFKNEKFPKTIADGHSALSNHVSPKGKLKKEKDAPTLKLEEDAKALTFSQTKLKGSIFLWEVRRTSMLLHDLISTTSHTLNDT